MPVSKFMHEGVAYEFQPPIEMGERTAKDLPELVAIAREGADVEDGCLKVARLSTLLVLNNSERDQLSTLNSLLEGRHQVTVA